MACCWYKPRDHQEVVKSVIQVGKYIDQHPLESLGLLTHIIAQQSAPHYIERQTRAPSEGARYGLVTFDFRARRTNW